MLRGEETGGEGEHALLFKFCMEEVAVGGTQQKFRAQWQGHLTVLIQSRPLYLLHGKQELKGCSYVQTAWGI